MLLYESQVFNSHCLKKDVCVCVFTRFHRYTIFTLYLIYISHIHRIHVSRQIENIHLFEIAHAHCGFYFSFEPFGDTHFFRTFLVPTTGLCVVECQYNFFMRAQVGACGTTFFVCRPECVV